MLKWPSLKCSWSLNVSFVPELATTYGKESIVKMIQIHLLIDRDKYKSINLTIQILSIGFQQCTMIL